VDGSIIELLRVGHFERAYPNKDWGAHKIKTSVLNSAEKRLRMRGNKKEGEEFKCKIINKNMAI
jgi:hypothetical protein